MAPLASNPPPNGIFPTSSRAIARHPNAPAPIEAVGPSARSRPTSLPHAAAIRNAMRTWFAVRNAVSDAHSPKIQEARSDSAPGRAAPWPSRTTRSRAQYRARCGPPHACGRPETGAPAEVRIRVRSCRIGVERRRPDRGDAKRTPRPAPECLPRKAPHPPAPAHTPSPPRKIRLRPAARSSTGTARRNQRIFHRLIAVVRWRRSARCAEFVRGELANSRRIQMRKRGFRLPQIG